MRFPCAPVPFAALVPYFGSSVLESGTGRNGPARRQPQEPRQEPGAGDRARGVDPARARARGVRPEPRPDRPAREPRPVHRATHRRSPAGGETGHCGLAQTVDLATVKQDHLVFIDQVIGSQRLRTVSAVGEVFPLYCTANGKAYLAELDRGAIEKLIGTTYERRTPKTLTRLDRLLKDLSLV